VIFFTISCTQLKKKHCHHHPPKTCACHSIDDGQCGKCDLIRKKEKGTATGQKGKKEKKGKEASKGGGGKKKKMSRCPTCGKTVYFAGEWPALTHTACIRMGKKKRTPQKKKRKKN
jgi:hypothetical protein